MGILSRASDFRVQGMNTRNGETYGVLGTQLYVVLFL